MKRFRVVVLWLLVACGDDNARPELEGDAGSADASVPRDARPPLDGASDANAPPEDARVDRADAAPADASADASAPMTLRATLCGDQTSWPDPLPATGMRSARPVEDGFGFIEGPVWIRELGVLLFSDMNFGGGNTLGPPSQIRRLDPPSAFDVLQPSAGSNGLALFAPTTLLAATHDTRSLTFFDAKTGARTNLAVTYEDKHFNSPNDLAIRDDGWVYFSDPDYQLGARSSELKTAVYRVQLSATTTDASAQLIDDSLTQPNGVALSPDQKTLYIGSSGSDIFKWDLAADGSAGNKTSFAKPGASDGLAVDCAGNLYVTTDSVEVFAPDGSKLGEITVADPPSNVAFGGPDAKTLYITARDTLYAIDLNVPGFPY